MLKDIKNGDLIKRSDSYNESLRGSIPEYEETLYLLFVKTKDQTNRNNDLIETYSINEQRFVSSVKREAWLYVKNDYDTLVEGIE